MESSFLNIARGNRLNSYIGLKMGEGKSFRYAADYTYIEIPVRELINVTDDKTGSKGLRNQHVRILPACEVNVRGNYKLLVEPNPELAAYGSVQGMYYIQPGQGEQVPGFYITLRKDLDLSDLNFAVRLYLRT